MWKVSICFYQSMWKLCSYHRTIWLIISKVLPVMANFYLSHHWYRAKFDKSYPSLWQVNPKFLPESQTSFASHWLVTDEVSHGLVLPDVDLWQTRFRMDWFCLTLTCDIQGFAWIGFVWRWPVTDEVSHGLFYVQ